MDIPNRESLEFWVPGTFLAAFFFLVARSHLELNLNATTIAIILPVTGFLLGVVIRLSFSTPIEKIFFAFVRCIVFFIDHLPKGPKFHSTSREILERYYKWKRTPIVLGYGRQDVRACANRFEIQRVDEQLSYLNTVLGTFMALLLIIIGDSVDLIFGTKILNLSAYFSSYYVGIALLSLLILLESRLYFSALTWISTYFHSCDVLYYKYSPKMIRDIYNRAINDYEYGYFIVQELMMKPSSLKTLIREYKTKCNQISTLDIKNLSTIFENEIGRLKKAGIIETKNLNNEEVYSANIEKIFKEEKAKQKRGERR